MSRTKVLENVKLTSFDDLFGGKNIEKAAEAGDVKEVPLSELHEFYNHPFQIRSDEELAEIRYFDYCSISSRNHDNEEKAEADIK